MGIKNDFDVFSPNQYENVYYEAPIVALRAPGVNDKYEIGKVWIDKSADDVYFMTNVTAGSAVWINAGGGTGVFAALEATTGNITADAGDLVATTGDLNIVAGGATIGSFGVGVVQSDVSGVLASTSGNDGQVLIDSTAGAPAWANLTAGAGINITNAANSVTITATGAVASTFPTDGGTATPAAGATTFAGGSNITTSGAGSTVTIDLDASPSVAGSLTAGVDLNMTSGDCTITGTTDGAQTIYLHANGGTSETIDIHSDQGTDVASVYLHSDVGGITLYSGLANPAAIGISTTGGITSSTALTTTFSSSKNASDAIVLEATNGGIDITSSGGAAEDIDITATSSINLVSSEDAAYALYLHANGGTSETIDIHSDQGTGVASINMHSDVGGVTIASGLASNDAINISAASGGLDIDTALQMNLTSSQAAADAIVIDASNAAGGIDVDYGTGGFSLVGGNGAFNLETGTGAINIGADAAAHTITVGNVTGATQVDVNTGTGGFNVTSTGTGDITLDSDDTILIDADGVLEINSSGGIIGIGNDADAQNINIGTGAAARTITVGNATGASSVVVNVGTGNADFGVNATDHSTRVGGTTGTSALTLQSGTGAQTFTAGGAFDVNATGNVTIDSSGGTLGLGEGADAQNINIGTGAAARTITVGNVTGATQVDIDCGTGGVNVGTSATAHTTTVGSTNSTADTTIQTGTGAMTFTAGGAFDVNAAGAVTIDSSASTISIGADDIDQNVNIASDGERTLVVGSTNGAADTTIQAGTGGLTLSAAGIVDVVPVTASHASAVTIDANVGVATLTGYTTASAATESIVITNSVVTAGSAILCSCSNLGANDAQMTITRILPASGQFTVQVTNNGAAALNGDIILTFWVIA